MAEVKTRKGGIKYEIKDIPGKVTLNVFEYAREELPSNYYVHHIYVDCAEIKKSTLPTDANPREPDKTPQVEAMENCLKDTPEDFVKLNNGMTLVCKGVTYKVEKEIKKCEIDFGEGEGICNGGHTYFTIMISPLEEAKPALVHLEVIQLPDNLIGKEKIDKIKEIASARNNNNRLRLRSEADFLGYYESFKMAMKDKRWVVWHEGDSEALSQAINAEFLIRILSAMDPLQYQHPIHGPTKSTHMNAVRGEDGPHKSWFAAQEKYEDKKSINAPLGHMTVLINDILELRDYIAESFSKVQYQGFKNSNFYKRIICNLTKNEEEKKKPPKMRETLTKENIEMVHNISATEDVLILGLFRTNIRLFYIEVDGSGNKSKPIYSLIGYYKDPKSLWDSNSSQVLKALSDDFTAVNDKPVSFIGMPGPYRNNVYQVGTGAEEIDPEILYEIASGIRYVKTSREEAEMCLVKETQLIGYLTEKEKVDQLDPKLSFYKAG